MVDYCAEKTNILVSRISLKQVEKQQRQKEASTPPCIFDQPITTDAKSKTNEKVQGKFLLLIYEVEA